MEYKEFVKDFIIRTRENIDMCIGSPYEVTQLINSSLGLLIIPKEKEFQKINDKMISQKLLDKMKISIIENTYPKEVDLKEIVLHLRNSISHARIECLSSKVGKNHVISHVIFIDKGNYGKKIKLKISIECLREFFYEFSDAMCKALS